MCDSFKPVSKFERCTAKKRGIFPNDAPSTSDSTPNGGVDACTDRGRDGAAAIRHGRSPLPVLGCMCHARRRAKQAIHVVVLLVVVYRLVHGTLCLVRSSVGICCPRE